MSPFALLYYYIGFPGLGIRDFHIDSTAISIGDLEIKWYGLIIVCGMIAAVVYTYLRAHRLGLVFDDIIDIALSAIIPGVIGARLYYVFFDFLKRPENYDDFIDVIAVWEGGLAIYGGLIFGVLGAVVALKLKKIRISTMLDCAFPGVLLAQSMGRWGNFFNMEAYGSTTNWFCRMRLSSESGLSFTEVHPTFLYESIWNFIGFIILTLIFKKKKFDGQIFLMAVSWYGFGRFFIEGLRQDSLWIGNYRISQVLAGALFVVSLALLIYMLIKTKASRVAKCIYMPNSAKYVSDEMLASEPSESDESAESAAPVDELANKNNGSDCAENEDADKASEANASDIADVTEEGVGQDTLENTEEASGSAEVTEEKSENDTDKECACDNCDGTEKAPEGIESVETAFPEEKTDNTENISEEASSDENE